MDLSKEEAGALLGNLPIHNDIINFRRRVT